MLRTPVGRLRLIAMLEGASFLVLLGVAMPLKYLGGMPHAVRVPGLVHGFLFLAFLYQLASTHSERDWPLSRTALVFVAALLPFGPFVIDRRLATEDVAE